MASLWQLFVVLRCGHEEEEQLFSFLFFPLRYKEDPVGRSSPAERGNHWTSEFWNLVLWVGVKLEEHPPPASLFFEKIV